MKTFLIQTINKELVYDFSLQIKEAIKYHNWFYNSNDYEYIFLDNIDEIKLDIERINDYIPVGSIDFTLNFYNQIHKINISPVNIPNELWVDKFLNRKVATNVNVLDLNLDDNDEVFIKSKNKFKEITDIVRFKDIPKDKELIISETMDIKSEWRCFVFRDKLVGIKNYQGEYLTIPNIDIINDMIKTYNKPNNAYTIDVGVVNNKTVLIEVHDFFSCGLYGFNDYRYLLNMTILTHNNIIKNII